MADSSDRGMSNLFSAASSALHSAQGQGSHANPAQKPHGSDHKPPSSSHSSKPSYGEIFSSAQVVMDAAKTKLHKPSGSSSSSSTEGVDVGKLAGAAGTLIGAVSHYGKFEETGHGKYVHKAQDFLQSYAAKHGSHGNSAVPPPTSGHHGDGHGASGYPPSQNHQSPSQPYSADGYGYQGHTSGSHQSASQPYPAAGYTGNYGNQGHTNVHANANNEPPMAYPPPGYPTSGTGHHRAGS